MGVEVVIDREVGSFEKERKSGREKCRGSGLRRRDRERGGRREKERKSGKEKCRGRGCRKIERGREGEGE